MKSNRFQKGLACDLELNLLSVLLFYFWRHTKSNENGITNPYRGNSQIGHRYHEFYDHFQIDEPIFRGILRRLESV